jgi:hypothetical protein
VTTDFTLFDSLDQESSEMPHPFCCIPSGFAGNQEKGRPVEHYDLS